MTPVVVVVVLSPSEPTRGLKARWREGTVQDLLQLSGKESAIIARRAVKVRRGGNPHPIHPVGEDHYCARLDSRKVRAIRRSKETAADLARKYQVSPSAISDVRRRITWRHIE